MCCHNHTYHELLLAHVHAGYSPRVPQRPKPAMLRVVCVLPGAVLDEQEGPQPDVQGSTPAAHHSPGL